MDMQDIRLRAAEVQTRYNPNGLVPFPFTEMAEQLGNVDLLILASIPANISGAIYYQNKRFSIIISSLEPEVRQYFTTAHEFGHYFLHSDWLHENENNGFVDFSEILDGDGLLLRQGTTEDVRDVDTQKEREANNFAAELIMPQDKVTELWNLTHDITKCASAFQVSQAAMAIRLEKLGLVV